MIRLCLIIFVAALWLMSALAAFIKLFTKDTKPHEMVAHCAMTLICFEIIMETIRNFPMDTP